MSDRRRSDFAAPKNVRTHRFDLDQWPWALAAYSTVAVLVCFWRLGASAVIQMEGMVADGGRHMLASGDWLVPRVYGEIYTFKPALAYWLAAAAHAVASPPPEWLLRLPSAAAMFAMGLAVLWLTGRLAGHRIGSFCAIAALTGAIVVEKVKLAEFDGLLTAGLGVAMVAACYNLSARKARSGVWLLGYLGLTFGFLAKGVPALMLYGPGVLAAAGVTQRFRRLTNRRHLAAAMMFALLAGGYLAGVYRSSGPSAFTQPILESSVRGFGWFWQQKEDASPEFGKSRLPPRESDVAGKPLAALGRAAAKPLLILVAFLPWSLLLPLRLLGPSHADGDQARGLLGRCAGAFLVAGMLVFMAVPTHAMRYYMPLCVPVGILAGLALPGPSMGSLERSKWMRRVSLAAALVAAAMAVAAGFLLKTPPVGSSNRAALAAVGILALFAAVATVRARGREPIGVLMLLAVVCAISIDRLGVQVARESKRNLRPVARALDPHLPRNEPVWVLGPSDIAGKSSSLYFYLDRPVLAFRPRGVLPPDLSYCLLTTDRLSELEEPPGFVFDEITRVGHPWRDYLLGRCSWPSLPAGV